MNETLRKIIGGVIMVFFVLFQIDFFLNPDYVIIVKIAIFSLWIYSILVIKLVDEKKYENKSKILL